MNALWIGPYEARTRASRPPALWGDRQKLDKCALRVG